MEQARRPVAGDIYRHFKDRLYEVITIAIHSETEEELVIYKALYGENKVYARPLSMFLGRVDRVKYPDAPQNYRFELVKEEKKEAQVSQILMDFLDANTYREKIELLSSCSERIDDRMITNMAISMDVVLSEGTVEQKIDELVDCLRTKARFECERLR